MHKVCIDTNVFISGTFGGYSKTIVDLALRNEIFTLITCPQILAEIRKNLSKKLKKHQAYIDEYISDIEAVAEIYEPTGNIKYIDYAPDNLVLETAIMGGASILVTGDKRDLLPLKKVHGVIIEPPREFCERLQSAGLV